jgi:hypothetical protein
VWSDPSLTLDQKKQAIDQLNNSYAFPPGAMEQFTQSQRPAQVPPFNQFQGMNPQALAQRVFSNGSQAQVQPPVPPPPPQAAEGDAPPDPRLQRSPQDALDAELGAQNKRFQGQLGAASDAQRKAYDLQKTAIGQSADVQRQNAQAETQYLNDYAQKARELADDAQTNENFRQAELSKGEQEIRGILSDFRSRKVDPNRLYSRQRKVEIGNMIGGAFGALAAAKLGVSGNAYADTARQNLQSLQTAIDRDIDTQREEIARLGRIAGDKQNGLAMMRARFGDERQAEAALRIAQIDDIQNKFKAKLAQNKIPGVDAQQNELMAGLEERKAAEAMKFAQIGNENALREIALRGKAKASADAAGLKQLPATVVVEGGDSRAAMESADKLLESFKKKTNFVSGVAQFLPGTDATMYQDERKVAAQVIGRLLEGGKLSDADLPRYVEMLPSPGDGAKRAKNKIDAIKAMVRTKLRADERALRGSGYNTRGIDPGFEQMGPPVR